MFDIGWSELLLIGVVALVVIGPKDLPKALKAAGFWMRKARQISGEFRASLDQMVREAELDEVREQVKKATEIDLDKEFTKTIDPTGELAESLKPPDFNLDAPASAPKTIAPPAAETGPDEKAVAAPGETAAPSPTPEAPKAASG
jgi:sec-independent protein translocase protein TatB